MLAFWTPVAPCADQSSAVIQGAGATIKPWNVLFIIIDDHGPGLHDVFKDSPVHTPNMQRLASRGTWFTHAYVGAPACCPSRTALLTGAHASKTGVYYNNQAYRQTTTWVSRAATLPRQFLDHGYLTAGYGKIAHNRFLTDDISDYTPGYYKMLNRDATHSESSLAKHIIPSTKVQAWSSSWNWGMLPDDWDRDDPAKLQQDTEFANRTIALLRQPHEKPFFVACGFWRPHVNWYVPKRYYDRYPLDKIELPKGYRADDLKDVPVVARWLATHRREHEFFVKNDLWKPALQAYYASIAYVDEQIGRILDALEASSHRDQTLIVFCADNGWHTGEKDHWSKFYLSELACRVVFSISVPGLKPQVCEAPVSLLDVYPTLMSLCGIPRPTTHTLDGIDLTALLRGTTKVRGAPVLSTYGPGCHSIRDERFRYTRYRNGADELYDHQADPNEWTNLAGQLPFADVKNRLARLLPTADAPEIVPSSGRGAKDPNAWADSVFK
ncbi:MAG: sulfatase [Verrucomicrobiota bacterium]